MTDIFIGTASFPEIFEPENLNELPILTCNGTYTVPAGTPFSVAGIPFLAAAQTLTPASTEIQLLSVYSFLAGFSFPVSDIFMALATSYQPEPIVQSNQPGIAIGDIPNASPGPSGPQVGPPVFNPITPSQLPPSVENSTAVVVAVGAGSGDATGVTDNATIMAAFATAAAAGPGSTVKLRPGQNYYITQLVLPAGGNITFDRTGATLTQVAGVNAPMLLNAAAFYQRATTDGVMCATTLTGSTLSTAAPITELACVSLPQALPSGAQVTITTPNANPNAPAYFQTFTLSAPAVATATSLAVNSLTPNYAYPAGSVIGSNIVQSATAAFTSADVGRMVRVVNTSFPGSSSGPGPAAGPYYGQIATVYSATQVGVTASHSQLPGATANVTAQSLQIFNRDANIQILGGTDVYPNNTGAGTPYLWGVYYIALERIDGLIVSGINASGATSTVGKNYLELGDCTSFTVEKVGGVSYSALVQLDGPCSGGVVQNIKGYTIHDDYVAIVSGNYPTYSHMGSGGDITNVACENVLPTQATAGAIFKIVGGCGCLTDRISARTVKGQSLIFTPLVIEDSVSVPQETGGVYGTILLEDLDLQPPVGTTGQFSAIGFACSNIGKLVIKEFTYRQTKSFTAGFAFNPTGNLLGAIEFDGYTIQMQPGVIQPMFMATLNSNYTGDVVTFRRFSVPGGVVGSSTYCFYWGEPYTSATSTLNLLRLIDGCLEFSDSPQLANLIGTAIANVQGGPKKVVVDGGRYTNLRAVVSNVAGFVATDLTITGGAYFKGPGRIFDSYVAGCALHFAAGVTIDTVAAPWVYLNGATASCTVDGQMPVVIGTPQAFFTLAASAVASSVILSPYVVAGTTTLVAGTKAVANTQITATSQVRCWYTAPGGTTGALTVALVAGTGFTLNSQLAGSLNTLDTSTVYYEVARY